MRLGRLIYTCTKELKMWPPFMNKVYYVVKKASWNFRTHYKYSSHVWFIMVIELNGVQFGVKLIRVMSTGLSSIWNHKYDFRPKLHDTKFNYHFITSIKKSHNNYLITQIQDFCQYQYFIDSVGNKSCKIRLTMVFFVFHFPAIRLVTLNKPWNLIGCFVLLLLSHWLWRRCDFEPIRLQGSTRWFQMVVIKRTNRYNRPRHKTA